MDLRPDSNCLWLSADHNREQPKPRPNHFLPASGVHFLHGKHPPHVLFCAERACGACCFFVLPAPRAQGPPEQGARNYKEEQQDKAKGRRGTTTKAGAAAQSWELGGLAPPPAARGPRSQCSSHASGLPAKMRSEELSIPGRSSRSAAARSRPTCSRSTWSHWQEGRRRVGSARRRCRRGGASRR